METKFYLNNIQSMQTPIKIICTNKIQNTYTTDEHDNCYNITKAF